MKLFLSAVLTCFVLVSHTSSAQVTPPVNALEVAQQSNQLQNSTELQAEVKFDIGGYTVSKKSITYIKEKDQLIAPTIQIIGKNGIVFEMNNDPTRISFTQIFFGTDSSQTQTVPVDLEGNGSNYLIMSTFSGGVGCCYNYYLISLMSEKIEIRQIISALGSKIRFEKQEGNAAYHLKITDTSLVNFYLDEKEAYQPEITLIYNSDTRNFEPNLSLLNQKISEVIFGSIKDLTAEAVTNLQKEYGSLDIILKPIIINASRLAYSGNYDLSRRLIDQVWPTNYKTITKDKFQEMFACRLKDGLYGRELEKINSELLQITKC